MDSEALNTAIGIVGGAIVAIVITIVIEMLRRPKLSLRIVPPVFAPYPENRPADVGRALTIELVNESLPFLFRWMLRSPALQCKATISFYGFDGAKFLVNPMPARFARSFEPLPMQITIGEVRGVVVDPMRISTDSRIDVYPGESTPLDVVVKFDAEDECYGWSNLSYFSDPPWRARDWKLPKGRYLVLVDVMSSGQNCKGIFRLFNDGGPNDFRLERALPADKIQ